MENAVRGDIKKFIFGGMSEFTIINLKSNKFMRYKVVVARNNPHVFFVSCERNGKYVYAGNFKVYKDKLEYDKGLKGTLDSSSVEIKSVFWVIANEKKLGEVIEVLHHGKCSVCGRPLKDAESIMRGIGPICLKKIAF